MDAPNAYLQSSLDDEIYMKPPQGLMLPPHLTNHVLRVLKGLYGLKQSGRGWNKKITNYLTSIGFKALSGDNCVFINHTTHVIISLYVDDFLIFSKSMTAIKKLKSLLIKEYNMKDLGPAKFILGIRIRREKDKIMIDQSSYIRSFLQKYKMDKANSVLTPMTNYDACSPATVNEPRANQLEYQERIGSLMFLMINTRPDIAQAVGKLSQYTHDPAIRHRNAVDHLMKYLNGITNLALTYKPNDTGPTSYADAAYGDNYDRKSSYGHVLMLGNGAVIWASKKQRSVVTSTMEAEYSSMCQASKDIVWATRWFEELNFSKDMNLSIILNGDNQGTLDLIKNPEHHSRSKHMDIQLHYLREVVEDNYATIQHVSTHDMVADIFTKPLAAPIFRKLREKLGLREA